MAPNREMAECDGMDDVTRPCVPSCQPDCKSITAPNYTLAPAARNLHRQLLTCNYGEWYLSYFAVASLMNFFSEWSCCKINASHNSRFDIGTAISP